MSAVLPSPKQEARIYDLSLSPLDFDREESWVVGNGDKSFQENMVTDVKPGLGSDSESGTGRGGGRVLKLYLEL
jgi:hypothetical protein